MNVHVSVLQEEEIKIGLESEIIQGGGTVSGDYIPVPSTAEVGQTIVVKAVDENGKPTAWEAVDAADAEEIGTRLSSLADENAKLKDDLSDLAPAGAAVGQLFRVAAISEDGKYTMEPVDMPSGGAVDDVKIGSASVVTDGVAYIPYMKSNSNASGEYSEGIARLNGSIYCGISVPYDGAYMRILTPSSKNIDDRLQYPVAITIPKMDYAVKSAMCDGKGAAWTADEQKAARERMGMAGYELIVDIPTLETASNFHITLDSNGNALALKAVAIVFAGAEGGGTCLVEINKNSYLKFIASLEKEKFGSFVGIPLGNDYYLYCFTNLSPSINQPNSNDNRFFAGLKTGTIIRDIWFRGTVPAGSSIQIYGIRG